MSGPHTWGVAECAQQLEAGAVSAVELAKHLLARAQADTHGAFLALNPEATLAQATAADARRAAGARGALLGVPVAHKDVLVTRDWPSTAGSRMLANYQSPFDATVVRQLADAGMVNLGKLNCDEFAMGSGNEHSAFGPARNPWRPSHVPGGSSGGSAAAVAARLTPAATGTDTGGSIRQPASFCGITGIKPTYGRASRYGLIAYASSLDQAGVMARSAHDCALLLQAMCGPDPLHDATSLDVAVPNFAAELTQPLKGLRIGVPQEFFGDGLASDVRTALDQALAQLLALGAVRVDISLPRTELAIPAYYIIAPAEASSNLSRFDGVRYGHRASNVTDLADLYGRSRSEGLGAEVQRRILTGTYVLSHGYYDAYYLKAQQIRRLIAQDFQAAFEHCDVLFGPVAPSVAWALGEQDNDPVASYLADIYTLPASLAGLPAMSVPVGMGASGLPVGMQLMGNYLQESRLLALAHAYQQGTNWHTQSPGSQA